MRTHGQKFLAGRRQWDCLSRFSVHFFWLGFSKQNGVGFHRLRDALKRHPCRLGLKWASMPISPGYLHSAKKTPPKTKHGKSGTGSCAAAGH